MVVFLVDICPYEKVIYGLFVKKKYIFSMNKELVFILRYFIFRIFLPGFHFCPQVLFSARSIPFLCCTSLFSEKKRKCLCLKKKTNPVCNCRLIKG